jgi:hypothetical protein
MTDLSTRMLATAVLLAALAGCQSSGSPTRTATPTTVTVTVQAGSCHAGSDSGQPLPDPHCTPGAIGPALTTAVICRPGWSTSSVRPPESYTEPIKRADIRAYGYADTRLADYELDHLTPIETGGDPKDVRNLWPEPIGSAKIKDKVENAAHAAVCAGRMPLGAVQAGFEHDWVTLGRELGVKIP